MTVRQKGILFVISSPSGAGKTTLAHKLAAAHNLAFSVSYTTRAPRAGEVQGRDYHFIDGTEFTRMVENSEFAEWAWVHGNRYGTAVATVHATVSSGTDCLFDIDHQGGRQIRSRWPNDSLLCFILPPSMKELERRLRQRATDTAEVIARRLATAREELGHYVDYDYLVPNDDIDRAFAHLSAIYVGAHFTRGRAEPLAQALLAEAAADDSSATR